MDVRAWKRWRGGWALPTVLLTACEVGTPLPPVRDDVERLGAVRFGLTAAAVLAHRPEGEFDTEGTYHEFLDLYTEVRYGFLPWVEGRRPNPRARLEGVEIREELGDRVALNEAWNEAFHRIEARGSTAARCTSIEAFRLNRMRATFPDSIRITLTAEVVEDGDGLGYEAYLSTRMDTPAMVTFLDERGGHVRREDGLRTEVPCPLPEGGGRAGGGSTRGPATGPR